MVSVDQFLTKYLRELEEGNAAVFIGAGMSVSAGYVDWAKLLSPLAKEIGLDIDRETDFVSLAQFYVNAKGGRGSINQQIIDMMPALPRPSKNHDLLARLPLETYWTTNYDQLIEVALKNAGRVPDVKYTIEQLATTKRNRDAVVYKMHGDIDHPSNAILTKDDFERYGDDFQPFVNALQGDLVERTFLFLGIGFNDPNLDHVLSRVRAKFSNNQREHYAFQKRRTKRAGEEETAFHHDEARQRLVIEDLKRFNIQTVLVDDYEDVTDAIRRLEQRFRRRTVFVSASASTFDPWGEKAVTNFMVRLGEEIGERDLRLATGMGLGVGNALFTGALQSVSRKPGATLEDNLVLRPFPQHIEDSGERVRVWSDYRRDLIGRAGITLFLFGNKPGEDQATGVLEEYAIARDLGLIRLPIGATGYAAHSLVEKTLQQVDEYPSDVRGLIRDAVTELGNPTDDLLELVPKIVDLLDALTERPLDGT